jgi:hypothetical protein
MYYKLICILYALLCGQNFILVKKWVLQVTSIAASKTLSMSVDATKAHNMTLAGGASLNGGTFLVVEAIDRALKGSMAGERMNKSLGREVR